MKLLELERWYMQKTREFLISNCKSGPIQYIVYIVNANYKMESEFVLLGV